MGKNGGVPIVADGEAKGKDEAPFSKMKLKIEKESSLNFKETINQPSEKWVEEKYVVREVTNSNGGWRKYL